MVRNIHFSLYHICSFYVILKYLNIYFFKCRVSPHFLKKFHAELRFETRSKDLKKKRIGAG